MKVVWSLEENEWLKNSETNLLYYNYVSWLQSVGERVAMKITALPSHKRTVTVTPLPPLNTSAKMTHFCLWIGFTQLICIWGRGDLSHIVKPVWYPRLWNTCCFSVLVWGDSHTYSILTQCWNEVASTTRTGTRFGFVPPWC